MQAPLTKEAIEYAWKELARRAGLRVDVDRPSASGSNAAGVSFHYGQPSEVRGDAPAVVIVPSDPADWRRLVDIPVGSLETVSIEDALPAGGGPLPVGPLPVLFRGLGIRAGGSFARRVGNAVVFDCDLIASTLFLLSRWEETVIAARDDHGRIPFYESVAYRQGFLDRPLIDEYALILREWLKDLLPRWTPVTGRFSVRLSHDVDVVLPFSNLWNLPRMLVGHLVRRRDPALVVETARLAILQAVAPRQNASYRGIFRLAEISRFHGMTSAFYFMAAHPSAYDVGYDPASRTILEAIHRLQDLGFEIGFHPGYQTLENPQRLAEEKSRLDAVLGRSRYGGRQHYLRFKVPDTWRQWEQLGLTYDSTLTFAGHEGFRCGTCHAYYPFDLEANRVLNVQERPLIVMDGTLRKYRGLTPAEGESRVLELARRCRAVEGTFTLLWHNSSLSGDWANWGLHYERMVMRLAGLERESADALRGPELALRPA